MKSAIITLAGSSSRFSKSVGYDCHKSVFEIENKTILSEQLNLLKELKYDEIIIVTGYMSLDIQEYVKKNFFDLPVKFAYNIHFQDFGSCYSLILGIKNVSENADSLVFIEGDLIFDKESFKLIDSVDDDVITANPKLIEAKTAVAFYLNANNELKYLYDTSHNELLISEPFKKIGNSGQVWKFKNVGKLKKVIEEYKIEEFKGTNLVPINDYYKAENCEKLRIITFNEWFNCNTIDDLQSGLKK